MTTEKQPGTGEGGKEAGVGTVTKEAPKKKTVWSKIGTFLLYGWMLILVFIMGMIILISTWVKGCQSG